MSSAVDLSRTLRGAGAGKGNKQWIMTELTASREEWCAERCHADRSESPLVVESAIELPQHELVDYKLADCSQVYSSGK